MHVLKRGGISRKMAPSVGVVLLLLVCLSSTLATGDESIVLPSFSFHTTSSSPSPDLVEGFSSASVKFPTKSPCAAPSSSSSGGSWDLSYGGGANVSEDWMSLLRRRVTSIVNSIYDFAAVSSSLPLPKSVEVATSALRHAANISTRSAVRLSSPSASLSESVKMRLGVFDAKSTGPPMKRDLSMDEGRALKEASKTSTLPTGAPHDQHSKQNEEAIAETTPFAFFWASVFSSFSLTLITEFGDRTFFIAALMSVRYPKVTVFLGATSALVVQTAFSSITGQLLHYLPNNSITRRVMAVPVDDYAAAILLFVFGVLHLRAACSPEEEQEGTECDDLSQDMLQAKDRDSLPRAPVCDAEMTLLSRRGDDDSVDFPWRSRGTSDDVPRRDSFLSQDNHLCPKDAGEDSSGSTECTRCHLSATEFVNTQAVGSSLSSECLPPKSHSGPVTSSSFNESHDFSCEPRKASALSPSTTAESRPTALRTRRRSGTGNGEFMEAKEAVERLQYQTLGARPELWTIFREAFWVIFVAELGDKSMIATIALSAAQDPYGVFLGASLGHALVTLSAVLAGSLMQRWISERIANFIGATLFICFAVLTTLEGLHRQGILLWGFLAQKASALVVAYFAVAASSTSTSSSSSSIISALSSTVPVIGSSPSTAASGVFGFLQRALPHIL